MCIIVAKPKGISIPSKEILENCFDYNDNGAGLMFVNPFNHKVIIDKGYMTFKSFWKHLKKLDDKFNLKNTSVVFHFRIGTDGVKNNPANTHPFAIKRDLESLTKSYLETELGVAHNGIINNYKGDSIYSDTQHFISEYLFDLYKTNRHFYKNRNLQNAIELLTNSKFAFLDTNNDITMIGDFIEDEGIYYSNSTYCMTYDIPYAWSDNTSRMKQLPVGYSVVCNGGNEYFYVGYGDKYYVDWYDCLYEVVDHGKSYIGSGAIVYDENKMEVDLFEEEYYGL